MISETSRRLRLPRVLLQPKSTDHPFGYFCPFCGEEAAFYRANRAMQCDACSRVFELRLVASPEQMRPRSTVLDHDAIEHHQGKGNRQGALDLPAVHKTPETANEDS